jgi:hypothetical protein
MPKILITVNDEAGQHRGYIRELQVPEFLTVTGGPAPCYPLTPPDHLLIRIGEIYVPAIAYERNVTLSKDRVYLTDSDLARVLNHLIESDWVSVDGLPAVTAQWDACDFFIGDDFTDLSPWVALKAAETA